MTTETKGFTIEEVYNQTKTELESEKLLRIEKDFRNDPSGAIRTIYELSNAIERISDDNFRASKENAQLMVELEFYKHKSAILESETTAKDEHIEELKAELEEVKYELEEIKDENKDLQEQLEELPARDYYNEIGMSEADFC